MRIKGRGGREGGGGGERGGERGAGGGAGGGAGQGSCSYWVAEWCSAIYTIYSYSSAPLYALLFVFLFHFKDR